MSKSAPAAPDYTGAANAQANASKDVTNMQTWANRPTMTTPLGTSAWDTSKAIDPATGQKVTQWSNNVTLNPNSQAALDAQLNITKNRSLFAGNLLGNVQKDYSPANALNWSKLPAAGKAPTAGGLKAPTLQNSLDDAGQIQSNLSTDGLPTLDPSSKYNADAGNAIYGQFSDRAEPQFARQQDDLRSRLYAQGLRDTDTAFKNQLSDLNNTQNDARQQASYQATIGSGAEAQRMLGMDASTRAQLFGETGTQGNFANAAQNQLFGQNLAGGNFANEAAGQGFNQAATANSQNYGQGMQNANYANTLRNQAIQEAYTKQNQNLNAMNALLSGQQVQNPQFQNFSQAAASQAPQYLQAAQMQGQNALDTFNAQQAGTNGLLSGLGSVAGAAAMFSDRRLKRNIVPLGGGWYEYDYVWGEHSIGVMSDEVPHAVIKHSSGFDMVNYGLL